MIIGKREKGKHLRLYRSSLNEIESFSMLILSVEETKELLAAGTWLKQEDGSMLSTYEDKDALDVAWKTIAVAHQKAPADIFREVSKIYVTPVIGTSMLIRDDKKKIIRIAKRRETDNNNKINVICINNNDRELFFEDCHDSMTYKKIKAYKLAYVYDSELYLKWSDFMNKAYIQGLEMWGK